jgi:hypothetical protein
MYTKEQVIRDRKCGLKYLDQAVEIVGRQMVVDKTIALARQHAGVWGGGWSDVSWASGNAVKDLANIEKDISMTWNLDEAFTDVELFDIAAQLNLIPPPNNHQWKRCLKEKPAKPQLTLGEKEQKRLVTKAKKEALAKELEEIFARTPSARSNVI